MKCSFAIVLLLPLLHCKSVNDKVISPDCNLTISDNYSTFKIAIPQIASVIRNSSGMDTTNFIYYIKCEDENFCDHLSIDPDAKELQHDLIPGKGLTEVYSDFSKQMVNRWDFLNREMNPVLPTFDSLKMNSANFYYCYSPKNILIFYEGNGYISEIFVHGYGNLDSCLAVIATYNLINLKI